MLEKFKILAFADDELRSKIGQYVVQINPETYAHGHRTEFTTDRGIDVAGSRAQFKSRAPETVNFDLIIDATGVVPGVTSVHDELNKVRQTAYTFNGDLHSPNYLKLIWGKFAFDCMLTGLNVSYLLFSPSGLPLRAKLSMTFRQHQTPADLAKRAGKRSADLTHARVATDDSSLPQMCYDIYRNAALYPHVARANNLNDLMHLPVGKWLTFPPLED
ncbi:hypothetical protein [uncultured Ruegeria sp.]|uniref:CIS tube protein n=1 Tax=uncultured Ruegeria sp. TaxID=259304 RepID=UPI00260AA170|nr:hypothetical protein [uncultured Ruegeria sp.]